ncbi:unnamed protein product [Schistosoma mattheei]|uniref:Uncharacterized protein n=1 Tax=Schistosoma mattheei TaxID=31246 RepID=A0A183Q4Z5_9TREM|nr:unnamed protein product [Schistosoma mattheei]
MRSLSHGGVDSGPVYPVRGTAVGRWGERGGVGNYGRGGRGRRPGRGGLLHPPVSDVNHGHYTDDENIGNPIPCRGAKRTNDNLSVLLIELQPRETYGHRSAGGRIPRQSGRGSRRIGGPGRDSNWNNLMNNNGDVADRRRGSGDSDVLESDNLPDGLSAERANAGRHNRVGRHSPAPNGFYSDRERGDESEDTLNPSNENNFPCGDASSEDGGGCSVDNMRSRLNKYVHSR